MGNLERLRKFQNVIMRHYLLEKLNALNEFRFRTIK